MKRSLLNDKIEMKVPEKFIRLSPQRIVQKYTVEGTKPQMAYSNETGSVNLAFVVADGNGITAKEFLNLEDYFKEQYSLAPEVKYIKFGTENKNSIDFLFYEFYSQAIDTKIYNFAIIFWRAGEVIVCNMNVIVGEMEEWKPTFQAIYNSLVIK